MTRGLTIALALLVVAAIVVTIVAVVSSKRTKPTPSDTTGTTPGQTTGTTAPEQTTKPGDEPIVADDVTIISPVTNGNISKEWSAEIPVYSDTMEDYRVHLGVDIEADAGTPVYAAADGIIESVTLDPMMGQTIVISHNGGYKSVYQNLQTVIPEGIAARSEILRSWKFPSRLTSILKSTRTTNARIRSRTSRSLRSTTKRITRTNRIARSKKGRRRPSFFAAYCHDKLYGSIYIWQKG